NVNHFAARLGLFEAIGSQVLTTVVETFDVQVFYCGTDVGKSPSDAPIVPNDDIRVARERDSSNVECAGFQVSFVPEVRHLVSQMHIVREQTLPSRGVRAGADPIV